MKAILKKGSVAGEKKRRSSKSKVRFDSKMVDRKKDDKRNSKVSLNKIIVSPFWLQLSDPDMNQKYTNYLLKEVIHRAKFFAAIFLILFLGFLIYYWRQMANEDDTSVAATYTVIFAVQVLVLALELFLSIKDQKYGGFIGPSVLVGFVIAEIAL